MRRIIMLSYTEAGKKTNLQITACMEKSGDVVLSCCYGKDFMSTDELLRREWDKSSAFVFIGAAGIAVRHIAPCLKSKLQDPAVLVADEKGQFVIPLLSGHVGGGVALAQKIAGQIGAQAVITTATDVEARFAADVFAGENGLRIHNPESVRRISAALLRGQTVDLWSRLPLAGKTPEGLRLFAVGKDELCQPKSNRAVLIGLTVQEEERLKKLYGPEAVCVLRAGRYILGAGCKRGKSGSELEAFLEQVCAEEGIDRREVIALASIDAKREEEGLWELSRRLGVSFEVFSAEELAKVEEEVSSSEFVRQTVGVDNVCERSACCLAGKWTQGRWAAGEQAENADMSEKAVKGRRAAEEQAKGGEFSESMEEESFRVDRSGMRWRLAVRKHAGDGMTMALAELTWD